MSDVSLVIYDLDGTLIDSVLTISTLLNQMRNDLGLKILPKERFYPWVSLGGAHLIRNALELKNSNSISKYLKEFRDQYSRASNPLDLVYPGVHKTLNHLSLIGYDLALCTNKPRNLVENILNDLNLGRYFDYVNAGGDLMDKKPHPSNIDVCINFYGHPRDSVIMVGDSTVDQQLAVNSNVKFGFYAQGYDDGVNVDSSDYVINNHFDLISFIKIKEI